MQQWPFEFTSGTHRTHIERDELGNWNGKNKTCKKQKEVHIANTNEGTINEFRYANEWRT